MQNERSEGKKVRKIKNRGDISFETNDSSPECDMLKKPSDSESEKLGKVIECFFGQLCREMADPLETAAQLQKRGVLSKAMMKDMIVSPDSQQTKTINLVDELDKRLKADPDCLFVFIEVLLENEALQGVGKDLLREAGKSPNDTCKISYSNKQTQFQVQYVLNVQLNGSPVSCLTLRLWGSHRNWKVYTHKILY